MKKSQAFLVMGFVISVTLAIGFFMQIQEETRARVRAESMLSAVAKEISTLEITMARRLQAKEKEISYLQASLSKEKSINIRLAQNLNRSSKRVLVAGAYKRPIELEKIIVSSLLEAEGKVLAVDAQNDLVVINLGSANNLKNGDRLSVYRGDNFIANAELVKVQDEISAAMILSANNAKGIKVEVNDIVK